LAQVIKHDMESLAADIAQREAKKLYEKRLTGLEEELAALYRTQEEKIGSPLEPRQDRLVNAIIRSGRSPTHSRVSAQCSEIHKAKLPVGKITCSLDS
jgi:hypothetical protein